MPALGCRAGSSPGAPAAPAEHGARLPAWGPCSSDAGLPRVPRPGVGQQPRRSGTAYRPDPPRPRGCVLSGVAGTRRAERGEGPAETGESRSPTAAPACPRAACPGISPSGLPRPQATRRRPLTLSCPTSRRNCSRFRAPRPESAAAEAEAMRPRSRPGPSSLNFLNWLGVQW